MLHTLILFLFTILPISGEFATIYLYKGEAVCVIWRSLLRLRGFFLIRTAQAVHRFRRAFCRLRRDCRRARHQCRATRFPAQSCNRRIWIICTGKNLRGTGMPRRMQKVSDIAYGEEKVGLPLRNGNPTAVPLFHAYAVYHLHPSPCGKRVYLIHKRVENRRLLPLVRQCRIPHAAATKTVGQMPPPVRRFPSHGRLPVSANVRRYPFERKKPRANALGFVFYRAICEELLLQLAAQTGVCSDVLTAHLSVLERIGLSRILLCLYHDPAGVASLVKQIEYSVELYAAVGSPGTVKAPARTASRKDQCSARAFSTSGMRMFFR